MGIDSEPITKHDRHDILGIEKIIQWGSPPYPMQLQVTKRAVKGAMQEANWSWVDTPGGFIAHAFYNDTMGISWRYDEDMMVE